MGLTKEVVVGGRKKRGLAFQKAFLAWKMVLDSSSNVSPRWWDKIRVVSGAGGQRALLWQRHWPPSPAVRAKN